MNLLDLLGAGVTETTQAVGTRDAAKKRGLLEQLEQGRRDRRADLEERNLLSMIADREREPAPKVAAVTPESFGSPTEVVGPDGKRRLVQFGNRGGSKPVEGFTPTPDAPRPGTTPGSVTPAQATTIANQRRVIANVKTALDRFSANIAQGVAVRPGAARSVQESEYENLQLQLKELYNLGVLAGPDLMLMRRIVNEPASLRTLASAMLGGEEPSEMIAAQLQTLKKTLEGFENNLTPAGSPATPNPTGVRPAGPAAPPDYATWKQNRERAGGRP